MRKNISLVCKNVLWGVVCLVLAIIVFCPSIVLAETKLGRTYLGGDTFWDKSHSPYILSDDVVVPSGTTLTIGPGVQVLKDQVSTKNIYLDVSGGNLIIQGKGNDRVKIEGLWGISVENGIAEIANTDIQSVFSVWLTNSQIKIATTTISKSYTGLTIKNSNVKVWGSRITDNDNGIKINSSASPILMMGLDEYGLGGIGNAFGDISARLIFSNSTIANNKYYGLANYSSDIVYAVNNWWGTNNGPIMSGFNKIRGYVTYQPWLNSEPQLDPGKEEIICCSSIIFLPGLEGSYLYRSESILGLNTENTLWPPNRNDDVRKLFLSPNGSSTDSAIYSGQPIDNVFGIYDIYGKFMNFLDRLVSDDTISQWQSFGYDWRQMASEIVNNWQKKATTTEYLINNVKEMAQKSKTGKVTIVAHSNGGLIAKYLLKKLEEINQTDLIDSVISVAVPYLGTPQAIASILHGDGQSIGYGAILSQAVSRQLGENMPSAYSLLPSMEYFSKIFEPTIAFASSTISGLNDGSYPLIIENEKNQSAFIKDENNIRVQPTVSDIQTPLKGNALLSSLANSLHTILDPYPWPVSIANWAIVGWNTETVQTIKYFTKNVCQNVLFDAVCNSTIGHKALTTLFGDGTVVAKSADFNSSNIIAVDLKTVSNDEGRNISHGNILESNATQEIIARIIKKADNQTPNIQLPNGTKFGQPDYSSGISNRQLVISTHSPVELHVYDQNRNHTGIIAPPAGQDIESGLYTFYENKIPRSRFELNQETDDHSDTYITLPDNGQYSILVKGVGVGTFTLEIERQDNGLVMEHVEYNGLPVTPMLIASTTLDLMVDNNSTTSLPVISLASSSQPLALDIDGNGRLDIEALAGTDYLSAKFDWGKYLEVLKTIIQNLSKASEKNQNQVKSLINRINNLEKKLGQGKIKQIQDLSDKFKTKIGHKNISALNASDKAEIINLIDVFIAQYQ